MELRLYIALDTS